jgi:hypothetical protein
MEFPIEKELPDSCNTKITDFWKKRMKETLIAIYGNGLNQEELDRFLNYQVQNCNLPVYSMRNLYTGENWEGDLNSILNMVHDEDLIIGANGAFTVKQTKKIAEVVTYQDQLADDRSKNKNLMFAAMDEGNLMNATKFENIQLDVKELMNSIYGICLMPGFLLYSPDSASLITGQTRELISENMWTVEKLIAGNLCFKNIDEMLAVINKLLKQPVNMDMVRKYNIKIPTLDMLNQWTSVMLHSLPDDEYKRACKMKSLFRMVKEIEKDPIKSINYYYRYNLYGFLSYNPKVFEIINDTMHNPVNFYTPQEELMIKVNKKTGEKNPSHIFVEPMRELTEIITSFCISDLGTFDRVDKYLTRQRDCVILSDTDSIILTLDPWVNYISKMTGLGFDSFHDEDFAFKAMNIIGFVMTEICNFKGRNMARHCYVMDEYRKKISIKNEFLFKSLILYTGSKKNYSVHQRMQEGVLKDEISETGSKFVSSNNNPMVTKEITSIINDEVHRSSKPSLLNIMKRIYRLEARIRNEIMVKRNIEFGSFRSYKNTVGKNIAGDATLRAVEIWNNIYSDNKIERYSKCYVFNTKMEREDQLYMIKDESLRERLRDILFKNPIVEGIETKGLRTIAVPDTMRVFPEWLIDIIDIESHVVKHMQPITALLPSFGIYSLRVDSTTSRVSPLISL